MQRNSSQVDSSAQFAEMSAIPRTPDKPNTLGVGLLWGTVRELLMPLALVGYST